MVSDTEFRIEDHIVWNQTPERLYRSIKILLPFFPGASPDQQVEMAEQIRDWADDALTLAADRAGVAPRG